MYVGLERTYLYRIFVRKEGVSLQEYLAEFRLQKAAQMLRGSTIPIGEISTSVGFQDPSYFYKVFTGKYACTPKKYREMFSDQS